MRWVYVCREWALTPVLLKHYLIKSTVPMSLRCHLSLPSSFVVVVIIFVEEVILAQPQSINTQKTRPVVDSCFSNGTGNNFRAALALARDTAELDRPACVRRFCTNVFAFAFLRIPAIQVTGVVGAVCARAVISMTVMA